MKNLLNKILIVVSLLIAVGGLCYGGKEYLEFQKTMGGKFYIEHCFRHGVNLVEEETGFSLLHDAAVRGHVENALRLLENGADVNIEAKSGQTPLYGAVYHGHIELVDLLIKKGADVNNAGKKRPAGVTFVSGVDGELIRSSPMGTSPLIVSIVMKRHDMVRLLIKGGADVNAYGLSGDGYLHSPLYFAVGNMDLEMIELLVSAGAWDDSINEVINDEYAEDITERKYFAAVKKILLSVDRQEPL